MGDVREILRISESYFYLYLLYVMISVSSACIDCGFVHILSPAEDKYMAKREKVMYACVFLSFFLSIWSTYRFPDGFTILNVVDTGSTFPFL